MRCAFSIETLFLSALRCTTYISEDSYDFELEFTKILRFLT
jgi:hypothetical protein